MAVNCLLALRDHLIDEIEGVEAEIDSLEAKIDERRSHLATLEAVRRAAKISRATILTLQKEA